MRTLLLIDDQPLVRVALARAAKGLGFDTREAASGPHAALHGAGATALVSKPDTESLLRALEQCRAYLPT